MTKKLATWLGVCKVKYVRDHGWVRCQGYALREREVENSLGPFRELREPESIQDYREGMSGNEWYL